MEEEVLRHRRRSSLDVSSLPLLSNLIILVWSLRCELELPACLYGVGGIEEIGQSRVRKSRSSSLLCREDDDGILNFFSNFASCLPSSLTFFIFFAMQTKFIRWPRELEGKGSQDNVLYPL